MKNLSAPIERSFLELVFYTINQTDLTWIVQRRIVQCISVF